MNCKNCCAACRKSTARMTVRSNWKRCFKRRRVWKGSKHATETQHTPRDSADFQICLSGSQTCVPGAGLTLAQIRLPHANPRPAGWETGDTACWEACATRPSPSHRHGCNASLGSAGFQTCRIAGFQTCVPGACLTPAQIRLPRANPRPAGWETGDTAGWEACATRPSQSYRHCSNASLRAGHTNRRSRDCS